MDIPMGAEIDVVSPLLGGGVFFLQIVLYLVYAYFQYKLSKKLDIKYSWMAWIPLLSFFNTLFIAGKNIEWLVKWFILPLLTIILGWILLGKIGILAALISLIGVMALAIGFWRLVYAISLRTGHGTWWALGLVFAGWIFLPVTAIHYEKGDEITPRPFTGGKKFFLILFGVLPFLLLIFFLVMSIVSWIKLVTM